MIYCKDTTVSTNIDACSGQPGDVFTAEFQTAGRGRLDHSWQASRGENLLFSMVFGVGTLSAADIATFPLVVGLAIVRTLSERYPALGSSLQLKWPNDILVSGRKICGILCLRSQENIIAGIGINVNQQVFAEDLAARATSLAVVSGEIQDREAILMSVIASVTAYHARWMKEGFSAFVSEYGRYDCLKGRQVSVLVTDGDRTPVTGLCAGVQSDGSLRVGGTSVYAGEAHVCAL